MNNQYVDIPADLIGKPNQDQQWITAQLDRIDPWRGEQGHAHADDATLRALVLELRQQRDMLAASLSVVLDQVGACGLTEMVIDRAREALKIGGAA